MKKLANLDLTTHGLRRKMYLSRPFPLTLFATLDILIFLSLNILPPLQVYAMFLGDLIVFFCARGGLFSVFVRYSRIEADRGTQRRE